MQMLKQLKFLYLLLILFTVFFGVKPESSRASGLQSQILLEGIGSSAQAGNKVAVHYTGKLSDGTVFDSSLARNKPFVFTLGAGEVIKGWDQGIQGMKVGEKRQLTIPTDLAYGAAGAGSVIPPNAILVFEVEMLKISSPPKLIQATSSQLLDAQKSDIIIVDIRRTEEWLETGIIEGAKTITAFTKSGQLHPDFQSEFMSIVTDLDTPVFLYCRTGNRTETLGNALVNQVGFSNVAHLDTGIVGWKKDGLPTVAYRPKQ